MPDLHKLERKIEACFNDAEANGWFPPELNEESDAQYWRLVEASLRPAKGMRILDAGCARGRYARRLSAAGAHVTGMDLTALFLHDARRAILEVDFVQATLRQLPFADATFDGVLCNGVLCHLADRKSALSEMARILKPGGTLLVIDHNLTGLHPRYFLPASWVKWYQERKGLWMYPPGFEFRENYFRADQLSYELGAWFSHVDETFVTEGHGRASALYNLFPSLSCEAAWVARR